MGYDPQMGLLEFGVAGSNLSSKLLEEMFAILAAFLRAPLTGYNRTNFIFEINLEDGEWLSVYSACPTNQRTCV